MGLAELAANEGNEKGTARANGVPRTTLRGWAKNPDRAASPEAQKAAVDKILANLDAISLLYTDRLLENPFMLRATPQQAAVVTAIAIDKSALLRGDPAGREEVTLFSILGQLGSGDQEAKGVEGPD
jgi:hypothetical protein